MNPDGRAFIIATWLLQYVDDLMCSIGMKALSYKLKNVGVGIIATLRFVCAFHVRLLWSLE